MTRVEATIVVDLPDTVHVGDVFAITGQCRVVMIRDELVDVTTQGGPREYVAGERSFELLITDARAAARPS